MMTNNSVKTNKEVKGGNTMSKYQTINKSKLFKKAHELTRKFIAENPDFKVNYQVQFGIYLKMLWAATKKYQAKKLAEEASTVQAQEQKAPAPQQAPAPVQEQKAAEQKVAEQKVDYIVVKNEKVYAPKDITIAGETYKVTVKIDKAGKLLGNINGIQFVWNRKFPLPKFKVQINGIKIAKRAIPFILARIGETAEETKEQEYVHYDELGGVWMNIFKNGYIRGEIEGTPFAWDMNYPQAVAVSQAGFDGIIETKIDATKIQERLVAAGFKCRADVYRLFDKNYDNKAFDKPFFNRQPSMDEEYYERLNRYNQENSSSILEDSLRSVIVADSENDDIFIVYHENGNLTGYYENEIGKKFDFVWHRKDGIKALPAEVRKALKAYGNMNGLDKYAREAIAKQQNL